MSQATVNWGDGTAAEQVPVTGNAQAWSFTGKQHTYAAPGSYSIVVTGLSGGTDAEPVTVNAAPTISGTPVSAFTLTGTTLTFAKPAGLVVGDWLLVWIRAQVQAGVDWSCPGWGRFGPLFVANSADRDSGFFLKPIVDLTQEPSSYTFGRSTTGRNIGTIMVLKGVGKDAQSGFYDNFSGLGTSPHKYTDPYTLDTLPALQFYGIHHEHSANVVDTMQTPPPGFTLRASAVTDTVLANARTSLYLYSAAVNTGQGLKADATLAGGTSGIAESVALRGSVNHRFANVAAALAKPGVTSAHRGNSVTYAEMSKNAYLQSDARGYSVLEYSVARTSDGVWFGLHDEDINRTSKTTGQPAASAMTWAQVQGFKNLLALDNIPQDYYRFDTFLADWANTHVVMVDPKYAWLTGGSPRDEFWALLAPYPKDHIIIKGFIDSMSLANAAKDHGYQSWGYAYEADTTNASFTTWCAAWTILGMDINASTTAWTAIKAQATPSGKKIIGHIATSREMYASAITKGADGVQVASTAAVPTVSAAP